MDYLNSEIKQLLDIRCYIHGSKSFNLKLNYKQQISLQGFVLVLLLGLSWTNIASYCFVDDSYSFELFDPFDAESEKEEQKSEEKIDDKIRSNQDLVNLIAIKALQQDLLFIKFQSLHYPEIYTPPPEFSQA